MARVANDGEVGAQVGSCDRLLAYAGASRGGCVAVDGLALTGGVEVFSDAVGVDEPGGHAGGGGDCDGGDGLSGGLHGLEFCSTRRLCRLDRTILTSVIVIASLFSLAGRWSTGDRLRNRSSARWSMTLHQKSLSP